MNRRTFIGTLTGGFLAAPLAAEAQQASKVWRIGILGNVPLTDPEGANLWGAFVQGLRELGYVEDQNITIERRSSEGQYERLPALAADLVRLKVDVIVVPASENALAAQRATRTIPIVSASLGDHSSAQRFGKDSSGSAGLPKRNVIPTLWLEETIVAAVYASDVDETLEVSKGPVKLADLVKLREHGHIVGLCGNWAMVTLHCPDWHHFCSFVGPCGIEKDDFLRPLRHTFRGMTT